MFVFLVTITGCKHKKIEKERLCSRIDLETIVSMLPTTLSDVAKIGTDSQLIMNDMIKSIDNIAPDQRTFANTIRPYDSAKFQFITNKHILGVVATLASDDTLRFAANKELSKLEIYEAEVLQRNTILYHAFKDYRDFGKDAQHKSVILRQFLRQIIDVFEHQGASLPLAMQTQIAGLQKNISDLEARFNGNIVYDSRSLVFALDELHGLPNDFVQQLRQNEQGDYIVPLDFKTFFTVMENCSIANTRREYFRAFGQRAYPQNISVLQSLLQSRHKLAEYLDYPNYASYELHPLMAKNSKRVEKFLWGLIHELQKYDDKDFLELTKFLPDSVELTKDNKLKMYDEAFVKSLYRKNNFDLNDYEIADYFPLDHTLGKLLELFKKFFHVEFIKQEVAQGQLWAPDVICYKVRSLTHQVLIGYLFFDLYSASYKKVQEPLNMMLIPTIKDDCSISCPGASVIVASFDKPSQDKPTLLDISNVRSLFHELGHGLHVLFGSTCFADFAGTQVAKDFVEVPSQMLEHWLEDEQVLQSISKHHITGDSLPKNKIQQILQAEKFGKAGRLLKQAYLGLISLYISMYGHAKDIHKMIERVHKKVFKHVQYDPHYYFEYNFAHLANYGAAYYTYVWSRVIAADLFEHIKQHGGIYNYDVGKEYVRDILVPGGFVPPHVMLKKFLKRPFNTKAFMQQFN